MKLCLIRNDSGSIIGRFASHTVVIAKTKVVVKVFQSTELVNVCLANRLLPRFGPLKA